MMGTAAVAGCLEMQWLQMLCLFSTLLKRILGHSEHRLRQNYAHNPLCGLALDRERRAYLDV